MPRIAFASALQRVVACPPEEVVGATLRAVLDDYFGRHPRTRDYVLDEQGTLRKHVAIFIDGVPTADRTRLGDVVAETAEVHVMQALSGG